EQLRDALDTTPGSVPDRQAPPAPQQTSDEPYRVPEPPEDDVEADLELAAELEVGLTEDQVLSDSGFEDAPQEFDEFDLDPGDRDPGDGDSGSNGSNGSNGSGGQNTDGRGGSDSSVGSGG